MLKFSLIDMDFLVLFLLGLEAFIIFLILIQTRGASLGAGFGGAGGTEGETVRRGIDRITYRITVASISLFAFLLIVGFLV